MHNLDNLEDYSIVKDKKVDKEDTQMAKEENKVTIN